MDLCLNNFTKICKVLERSHLILIMSVWSTSIAPSSIIFQHVENTDEKMKIQSRKKNMKTYHHIDNKINIKIMTFGTNVLRKGVI